MATDPVEWHPVRWLAESVQRASSATSVAQLQSEAESFLAELAGALRPLMQITVTIEEGQ